MRREKEVEKSSVQTVFRETKHLICKLDIVATNYIVQKNRKKS